MRNDWPFNYICFIDAANIITCTIPIITNAKHSKNSDSDNSSGDNSDNNKQTTTTEQTPTERQPPKIATPTESDNTIPSSDSDQGAPNTTDAAGDSISSHSSSCKTIDRNLQDDDKEAVQKESSNQIDLTHFGVKNLNSTHFLIAIGNDTNSFTYVVAKKR